MNYILVDQYVDVYNREILILDFHPSISDIVPKVQDQFQTRENGWVRVWMTREMLDDLLRISSELEREMESVFEGEIA